jgi:hypothetical protein
VVSSDCGPGDRALQECNLSTEPSVDCESVPPRFGITPNRGCFPGMPSQPRLKRKTHPLYCRPLGRFHHQFTPELCCTAIFRKRIKTLRLAGQAGIDEFAAAFDQEMLATRNRLEEAEREIGRLKSELARRVHDEKISPDGLLLPGRERELFGGEQRDIVIAALQEAKRRVQPDGRIAEVLQSLIDANPPIGEGERIEKCIRVALQNCQNLGKQQRRQLEEVGFAITDDGKHLKLV